VSGERGGPLLAGEAQLGMAGDDEPGPTIRRLLVMDFRAVHPRTYLTPVTNQVTTAPGNGRLRATYPDTNIPLNRANQI
jgi:hypothetical protein